MHAFLSKHALFWKDKVILRHLALSVILLVISLFLTYMATRYTNNHAGIVAPDILLDSLPVFNVGFIFFQCAFFFIIFLFGIGFFEPKYIPFVTESTALFFLVRSFFMIMTHLAPPSIQYYSYIEHEHHVPDVLFTISSGTDLFFSAHAGYPFLIALIFWRVKPLRYFFLACSALGAIAVILGHLHYSIDVFSAFFIAFGIFNIAKYFFKKEYALIVATV